MRLVPDRLRRLAGMGAAVATLAASLNTTAPAAAQDAPAVAAATRYELIGTYDLARLDQVFGEELKTFMKTPEEAAAFDGLFPAARYPVKLYKVSYSSVVPEFDNLPTVASGLVAVPESGLSTMPVVSYQHGTVFDRNYVPSRPEQSMETRIMIARFAAQGYVVIGADYFGRGDSDLPDGYLVKGSAQQANYDMLIAAKSVLGALGITPGKLFLSGWSQGGWRGRRGDADLSRQAAGAHPTTARRRRYRSVRRRRHRRPSRRLRQGGARPEAVVRQPSHQVRTEQSPTR
jgi:hypothetical protein